MFNFQNKRPKAVKRENDWGVCIHVCFHVSLYVGQFVVRTYACIFTHVLGKLCGCCNGCGLCIYVDAFFTRNGSA